MLSITPFVLTTRPGTNARLSDWQSRATVRSEFTSPKCVQNLPTSLEIRCPSFRRRLFHYVSKSKFGSKLQKRWAAEAVAYTEVQKIVSKSEVVSKHGAKTFSEMIVGGLTTKTGKRVNKRWNQKSGGETPLSPW